jgi:hypothetical protein
MLPCQGLGDGLATLDIVSVTSDIAAAGTALAGLILVYLGAAAVRYETLDPKHQASARDDYRQHARRAFRGLVIALVAAVLDFKEPRLTHTILSDKYACPAKLFL